MKVLSHLLLSLMYAVFLVAASCLVAAMALCDRFGHLELGSEDEAGC